jgi:hypothetical protein
MYEEIKALLEEKEKYLTELCTAFEERIANLELNFRSGFFIDRKLI